MLRLFHKLKSKIQKLSPGWFLNRLPLVGGQATIANRKSRVGWTAFYTAAVWHELGVAHAKRFLTRRGIFVREMARYGGGLCGLRGGYSVTNLFLAPRHLGIDKLLPELQPVQVIEIAAGFTPRGVALSEKLPPGGVVVEVDQPGVVAIKNQLLDKRGRPPANYRLVAHDLAHESASTLLEKIGPHVKPTLPTVIIAEGLTGYLNEEALRGVLRTLRTLLEHFTDAKLIIDFYEKLTPARHGRVYWAMLPPRLIWKIMRASMAMFLTDEAQVRRLVESEGFAIRKMYTALELADLAGRERPPLNLFYVTIVQK